MTSLFILAVIVVLLAIPGLFRRVPRYSKLISNGERRSDAPQAVCIDSDGTIRDIHGHILAFDQARFARDIGRGACCLICGATPGSKPFNNEHILPRWVLRRYRLFDERIRLPNDTDLPYRGYTLPCCKDCNSTMSRALEKPVQRLFEGGVRAVSAHVKRYGVDMLLNWTALIFLKTHLKDAVLLEERDARAGGKTIGERYRWEGLHHVHCLARLFASNSILETPSTVLVLPAHVAPNDSGFDYADVSYAQTMMIRLDNICLIAVFNDATAVVNAIGWQLERITAPLSPMQQRELTARCAFVNLSLRYRPRFMTRFTGGALRIEAEVPDRIELDDGKRHLYGPLLASLCDPTLRLVSNADRQRIASSLLTGNWSFLFDNDGKFMPETAPQDPSRRRGIRPALRET